MTAHGRDTRGWSFYISDLPALPRSGPQKPQRMPRERVGDSAKCRCMQKVLVPH
jgi:hypothetical protein